LAECDVESYQNDGEAGCSEEDLDESHAYLEAGLTIGGT
jgi:hypothetical protein